MWEFTSIGPWQDGVLHNSLATETAFCFVIHGIATSHFNRKKASRLPRLLFSWYKRRIKGDKTAHVFTRTPTTAEACDSLRRNNQHSIPALLPATYIPAPFDNPSPPISATPRTFSTPTRWKVWQFERQSNIGSILFCLPVGKSIPRRQVKFFLFDITLTLFI